MSHATLALLLLFSISTAADQLRYDSARDWREWQLPLGAIEILPNGSLQPVRVKKTSTPPATPTTSAAASAAPDPTPATHDKSSMATR